MPKSKILILTTDNEAELKKKFKFLKDLKVIRNTNDIIYTVAKIAKTKTIAPAYVDIRIILRYPEFLNKENLKNLSLYGTKFDFVRKKNRWYFVCPYCRFLTHTLYPITDKTKKTKLYCAACYNNHYIEDETKVIYPNDIYSSDLRELIVRILTLKKDIKCNPKNKKTLIKKYKKLIKELEKNSSYRIWKIKQIINQRNLE